MPSISFFLLSPLSRLPVFHSFVVADIALGYSSSSCRLLHSAKNYDHAQISLCAYLVAAYIPIAKARGITPLFDKLLIRQKDNTNIGPVKMPTLIFLPLKNIFPCQPLKLTATPEIRSFRYANFLDNQVSIFMIEVF